MRISQKMEYACRAMAQLAKRRCSGELTRLDEIAQTEVVSANFLVQILADLRRAGLVLSQRGKDGGYELARDANQISLAEIIEAIDPEMFHFMMSQEGQSGPSVARVWRNLSQKVQAEMKQLSLDDMIHSEEEAMFYI